MESTLRIGLLVDSVWGSCTRLLAGIHAYAWPSRPWMFLHHQPTPAGLAAVLAAKPDGIIAYINRHELATAIRQVTVPLVDTAHVFADPRLPRVSVDDAAVGAMAARHFLDRGFRNFAFFGQTKVAYALDRRDGFERAVAAEGHACASFFTDTFRPHRLDEQPDMSVVEWVRALPKPVAVLAHHDHQALMLSQACRRAGLAIPDQVAILGVFDDESVMVNADPPLSSVRLPLEAIGMAAARRLDRIIAGEPDDGRSELLPPQGIVIRRSSDVPLAADPQVANAMRFIRANAHRQIAVGDVMATVSVSRRTLESRFRAQLGHGPAQAILAAHIERAKELLGATDLPVNAIAGASGLRSASFLCRIFRRATGMTPRTWRERHRR